MVKVVPLPSYNPHVVYTVVVNSLLNKFNEEPTHTNYKVISKMHIAYKGIYSDDFVLNNTIRGKFYLFLLNLSHILHKYNKRNIVSQIYDSMNHREIRIYILFKFHKYKVIKIYPWRTVLEMENELYDYNYVGIADGIMNIILNVLFGKMNILDIQYVKIITNIPSLIKKINTLDYTLKNAFEE